MEHIDQTMCKAYGHKGDDVNGMGGLVGKRLDALQEKRFMWACERVKRKLLVELGLETGPGAPVPWCKMWAAAMFNGGWRGVGLGRVRGQRWGSKRGAIARDARGQICRSRLGVG